MGITLKGTGKIKQTSVKNVTSKQFNVNIYLGKAMKENFADGGNILTNYAAPSRPFAK